MPAPNRIIVLNLGMQTVALAEFHASPNGALTLQQFKTTELLVDPGADASRPGQLQGAITQLKKESGLKSCRVHYALPSQAVFARYLALPGTTPEELDQIIGFEAQQNIPFPIDEVVWDYQALGAPQASKLNVALFAIKSDTLEALNASVESSGFLPDCVDVSPMALYNAFRFNYADEAGCSLFIDIGARTTNLIFIEGDKAYSRSIPIGGNAITTAIAKELEQPIEVAELAKKEKGFVSLGGSYAEPEDPAVARISKLARTTLTRLHAEIARSISFYRANQSGSQPLRALLAGGSVQMPYMLEFFAEKLQMPVEFFNPFRNVSVSATADQAALAAAAPGLGEVVGLALRSLGNCPVEINLRPPSVVSAHALKRRKPYLIAAALCLFLAIGQWWLYFSKATAVKSGVLEEVTQEVNSLQKFADEFDRLKAQQAKAEKNAAPLLTAAVEREAWIRIINELGAKLPPDFIWVTKLTPLSNGTPVLVGSDSTQHAKSAAAAPKKPGAEETKSAITALEIQGLYLQNDKAAGVIDDFVNNLLKSDVFAIKAEEKTKAVTKRSTPDDQSWAYAYTIVIPLKNPIALP